MLEKVLGSAVVALIIWTMSKDEPVDHQEEANDIFEKLRLLAGGNDQNINESRQKVWGIVSELHQELKRTPTLEEVVRRILF